MSGAYFFTYGRFGGTRRINAGNVVRMDVVTAINVEASRTVQPFAGAYTGVAAVHGVSPVTRTVTIKGRVTAAIGTGESVQQTRDRIVALINSNAPISFVSDSVVLQKALLTSAKTSVVGVMAMDIELSLRDIRDVSTRVVGGVSANRQAGAAKRIEAPKAGSSSTSGNQKPSRDSAASGKKSSQSLLFKAAESLRNATNNWGG